MSGRFGLFLGALAVGLVVSPASSQTAATAGEYPRVVIAARTVQIVADTTNPKPWLPVQEGREVTLRMCSDNWCYATKPVRGFLPADAFISVEEVAAAREAERVRARRAEEQRLQRVRREARIRMQEWGWSESDIALIEAKKIRIGMTPEMVRMAWGNPRSVNETINAMGKHEQWVYRSSYVYFDDGVVTSIQTSR